MKAKVIKMKTKVIKMSNIYDLSKYFTNKISLTLYI